ncbi:MAG: dihydroorotate dehydrogenase electron transfer subunit, partial [Spirochaetaceae bacterium]|nr:dihydroorotate dehydrogenase electron transfer subunit [Spirochaetaceae bacterium]
MNKEGPRTRGIARIYEQRSIARGYREITLSYALGYQGPINPQPGQFFTILPHRYPLTMMRRPFAYSASSNKGFSFIYEIRGTNTAELADLEEGCQVDWIGPLGSSFSHSESDTRPILIAGGIGVGPIYYFAQKLAEDGKEPLVILGARNAELIPHLDWPENVELRICTDDGSMGIHGSALVGLEKIDFENAEFFTCGPRPMMVAIHQLAKL